MCYGNFEFRTYWNYSRSPGGATCTGLDAAFALDFSRIERVGD